jgi:hypothetical protein
LYLKKFAGFNQNLTDLFKKIESHQFLNSSFLVQSSQKIKNFGFEIIDESNEFIITSRADLLKNFVARISGEFGDYLKCLKIRIDFKISWNQMIENVCVNGFKGECILAIRSRFYILPPWWLSLRTLFMCNLLPFLQH